MIDLPVFNVSIWGFDAGVAEADIGVALTPLVGSDRFTADWLASSEASGSGSATYTTSGQNVSLGTVAAVDGPGNAALQLSGFRYYFSQFGLDLGIYFYLDVLGYGSTWTIPITDFDLGGLMGGLFVGPHSGTASTLEHARPPDSHRQRGPHGDARALRIDPRQRHGDTNSETGTGAAFRRPGRRPRPRRSHAAVGLGRRRARTRRQHHLSGAAPRQ
jgi:hypothetical protein